MDAHARALLRNYCRVVWFFISSPVFLLCLRQLSLHHVIVTFAMFDWPAAPIPVAVHKIPLVSYSRYVEIPKPVARFRRVRKYMVRCERNQFSLGYQLCSKTRSEDRHASHWITTPTPFSWIPLTILTSRRVDIPV